MITTQSDTTLTLHSLAFDAAFDKRTGVLTSLIYGSRPVISGATAGPLFNLYRARLDNDRTKERGPAIEWMAAGYDSLQYTMNSFTLDSIPDKTITTITTSRTRSGFSILTTTRYTFHGNGVIDIHARFEPSGNHLDIPRLGLRMFLDKRLEHVEWYGRGPHENYPDRKSSAAFGRYSGTVTGMLEPYERPQGMANREDCRWLRLIDDDREGIEIVAKGKLSFTTLHFTDQDLWQAKHLYQLQPRKETVLSLDYGQLGVGNASCGPTPLPQYYLPDAPAEINFQIQPYHFQQ